MKYVNIDKLTSTKINLAPEDGLSLLMGALADGDRADIRDLPAIEMNLLGTARSDEAKAAVAALADVILPVGSDGKRRRSKKYIPALTAIVVDLLRGSAATPVKPCFRPKNTGSFSEGRVSYRPFMAALGDLKRAGFISELRGQAECGKLVGVVTRLWATVRLTDHFIQMGVNPTEWRSHFDRHFSPDSLPVVTLRARSTRSKTGKKIVGRKIKVDQENSKVKASAAIIRDINAFVQKQKFEGIEDIAFFRGFNEGDQPSFDFNWGGRVYCHGGGYQNLPRYKPAADMDRSRIRINDEETVEVDISGCFITILYGLMGIPLRDPADPYESEKFKGINLPRHIVKTYVNMTLGHNKYHKKWPDEVKQDYRDKYNREIQADYPIGQTEKAIVAGLPIMQDWPDNPISWADLQFVESEVMLATITRLKYEQGICVLPVHDSVICQKSHVDIVMSYLAQAFYEHVGSMPIISMK